MSKRDLYDICKGKLTTMEEFNAPYKVLLMRGYLYEVEIPTGGRPTYKIYRNPLAKVAEVAKDSKVWTAPVATKSGDVV